MINVIETTYRSLRRVFSRTTCIDHIPVRGIDSVSNVQVPHSEILQLASDHLPLMVDITFDDSVAGES